jgi:type VII secretion protein EccB
MQTKRDLLQAHRLMTQRAGQALILGEPDYPEQPMKRLNVGTFAGIMVSVLVAAVFGILGVFLGGGGDSLRKDGLLLIEKETGSRFVWCTPEGAQDKVLCPVVNYASAKLAVGEQGTQKSVSAKSLAGFARGPRIGIPGAPDTIPEAKRLVSSPWSVCARRTDDGTGRQRSVVSLVAGRDVGGKPVGESSVVVVGTSSESWVIWKNQRMRVSQSGLTVLGSPQPAQVAPKFINALPSGPDFKAPAIPDYGSKTGRGTVGQVFVVKSLNGGEDQWYVLLKDGFTAVSPIEAALIQSDASYHLARQTPLDPNTVTSNRSATHISSNDLPQTRLAAVRYDETQPLCVVYPDTSKGAQDARLTIGGGKDLPAAIGASTGGGVDQVVLPPGSGVLAGVLPGAGQVNAINTYMFIADNGRKYPLKSADTAKALGYSTSAENGNATPVPPNLLNLLPTGPVLDPGMALLPVPAGASG